MNANGTNPNSLIMIEIHFLSGLRTAQKLPLTPPWQLENLCDESRRNEPYKSYQPPCECCSCWSPDGRKIAFESTRDGNFDIYTMNIDGTDIVRLTNHPGVDSSPCLVSC